MRNKIMKESAGVPAGIISKDIYGRLLTDISGIVIHGRTIALRQINVAEVVTYWLVGRRIVEFYQEGKERAGYGEQLLSRLAADIVCEIQIIMVALLRAVERG